MTTGVSTPPGTYQIVVVSTISPQTNASASGPASRNKLWCALLGLPLGCIWCGRKRRRWLYPGAGILGLFLVFMVGCSSGTATPTTTTTTSQASMTLTLTVN